LTLILTTSKDAHISGCDLSTLSVKPKA